MKYNEFYNIRDAFENTFGYNPHVEALHEGLKILLYAQNELLDIFKIAGLNIDQFEISLKLMNKGIELDMQPAFEQIYKCDFPAVIQLLLTSLCRTRWLFQVIDMKQGIHIEGPFLFDQTGLWVGLTDIKWIDHAFFKTGEIGKYLEDVKCVIEHNLEVVRNEIRRIKRYGK